MVGSDGPRRTSLSLVSQLEDVAYYVRKARGEGAVLVLGCANGRIAWELAEQGKSVVGVDPSGPMIRSAEERRSSQPQEVSARLKLIAGDLRALRLKERFPLVLAPHNVVGMMPTLEELDAFFAAVRHHLAPEGEFLFDALNPQRSELHEPEDQDLPSFLEPRRAVFAPHLRERLSASAEGKAIRRLRVGQFFPAEIDAAARAANLEILERFGSFGEKPFEPSDPIQVLAAGLADR